MEGEEGEAKIIEEELERRQCDDGWRHLEDMIPSIRHDSVCAG